MKLSIPSASGSQTIQNLNTSDKADDKINSETILKKKMLQGVRS